MLDARLSRRIRSDRRSRGVAPIVALLCVVSTGALTSCALVDESQAACDDDEDNDRDGRVDCADPGCFLEPSCQPCGDGRLDDGEACDDGNTSDGDACSSRCLKDDCGNGELDPGESCDDGNLTAGDGCSFRCEVDRCGNGLFDPGEQCDDGNGLSGDGCSARCALEVSASCGNGRFDPGEDCEDGNRVGNDGCSPTCRFEFCGDNVRQPRLGEACDGTDTPEGTTCQGCQIVRCGNGVLDAAFLEECDDGNLQLGDGCNPQCRIERCGDGFQISPEECDDGNVVSNDRCSSTCAVERCGDGVLQRRFGELCDDPADVTCVQCVPRSICDGEDCFSVDVEPVATGQPVGVALLRGTTPSAVFAARNFAEVVVMTVDTAGRRLTNERTVTVDPNFFGVTAIQAANVTAEDGDELLVGTADGRVSRSSRTGGGVTLFQTGETPVSIDVDDVDDANAIAVLGRTRLTLATRSGPATFAAISTTLAQGGPRALVLPGDSPTVILARATSVAVFKKQGTELVETSGFELGLQILDVVALDVNSDGVRDLVVMTAAPDELHTVLMDATGTPLSTSFLAPSPGGDFLTAARVDSDDDADLVVVSRFGTLAFHRAVDAFQRGEVQPMLSQSVRPSIVDVDADGGVDALLGGVVEFQPQALLLLAE